MTTSGRSLAARFGAAIAPGRLGAGFRWMLASSWLTNLGDGIALAAGPLLIAAQTRNPLVVALATLMQRLPWLLFGLYAGVLADRRDRRSIIVAVDLLRSAMLAALAAFVFTGRVNVPITLVALFAMGTAEVFADTTTETLLPSLVAPADLGIANARVAIGFETGNFLAGPTIGAALFAAGAASPFATQAVCMALGALLIAKIGTRPPAARTGTSTARSEMAAGVRWLWRHAAIRTLTITIVAFNVTFGAAWAVLVLYATEVLGLGEIGFGLMTTVSACGGILGSTMYGALERRVRLADIMRVGLIIETATHLVFALTTTAAVAYAVMFAFGVHASIWGTTARAIRQRAVPHELQGRIAGVYLIGVQAGLVAGAAVGGVVAGVWGVTAPFWFGFVGSGLILATLWRALGKIAHADTRH